jgi:hypothetical protein
MENPEATSSISAAPSKVKIAIPGDGNDLLNSILVGYLATRKEYPQSEGIELRTQQDLRMCIKTYYLNQIKTNTDTEDQIQDMLDNMMLTDSYPGFPAELPFRKDLEAIAPGIRRLHRVILPTS